MPGAPVTMSRIRKIVVIAAPTSTTKMTGFFRRTIGFSLINESRIARLRISGSNKGRACASFFGSNSVGSVRRGDTGGVAGGNSIVLRDMLEQSPFKHQVVLDNRTERKSRKIS